MSCRLDVFAVNFIQVAIVKLVCNHGRSSTCAS